MSIKQKIDDLGKKIFVDSGIKHTKQLIHASHESSELKEEVGKHSEKEDYY